MRVMLIKYNPEREELIDLRSDRKLRELPGNACCLRWAGMGERVHMPGLGMRDMGFNFCPTCGRKIKR
ncbi:MAG: hypothetical protein M0Z48_00500 [Nitrospiraceae bacterium]|nr:hypothetical protein [Nitrospiraceae bacterium]